VGALKFGKGDLQFRQGKNWVRMHVGSKHGKQRKGRFLVKSWKMLLEVLVDPGSTVKVGDNGLFLGEN
jgi:hypothetical protein